MVKKKGREHRISWDGRDWLVEVHKSSTSGSTKNKESHNVPYSWS